MHLNGWFYDPKQSGSGFCFITGEDGRIAGTFFGHTNDGHQLWATLSQRPTLDASSAEFDVFITHSDDFPVGQRTTGGQVGQCVVALDPMRAELSLEESATWLNEPSPRSEAGTMRSASFALTRLL